MKRDEPRNTAVINCSSQLVLLIKQQSFCTTFCYLQVYTPAPALGFCSTLLTQLLCFSPLQLLIYWLLYTISAPLHFRNMRSTSSFICLHTQHSLHCTLLLMSLLTLLLSLPHHTYKFQHRPFSSYSKQLQSRDTRVKSKLLFHLKWFHNRILPTQI